MKILLIWYLIVMFALIGILAAGFGLIAVSEWYVEGELRPVNQIVATDVEVTSHWTEITAETPMKPIKRDRVLYLIIEGYRYELGDDFEIKLGDGTVVNPEVEMVDEFGEHYELKDTTRVGNQIGLRPKDGGFPADRNLVKIRIRSDRPFRCSKIIWSNKTPK